jgi:hypothetical protein
MTDEPVDLDEHRGMAAQIATDIRRQRLHEFQVDQAALRRRQEELEKLLLAAPAETWPEAAAKAQYLIQLLSFAGASGAKRRSTASGSASGSALAVKVPPHGGAAHRTGPLHPVAAGDTRPVRWIFVLAGYDKIASGSL